MNGRPSGGYTRGNRVMGYDKPTQNNAVKLKYHCIATGEKRQFPCGSCVNHKGCLATTMQYKERKHGT